jgi:hypothetical protein
MAVVVAGGAAAVIGVGVDGSNSSVVLVGVGEEPRLELYSVTLTPRPPALVGRARSGVVGSDTLWNVD